MGAVSAPTAASRTPLGIGARYSAGVSPLRRPLILSLKVYHKNKNSALVSPPKHQQKSLKEANFKTTDNASIASTKGDFALSTRDLDYDEAAAKLENIYKLSPASGANLEECPHLTNIEEDETEEEMANVVRNYRRKRKRLSLEKRIAMRKGNVKEVEPKSLKSQNRDGKENYDIDKLVNEYLVPIDLVSLDWKKMKIPPVLSSSEQSSLFKLMQPMKALACVKEEVHKNLGREPTDAELAAAASMSVIDLRRHVEVGQAARNKLIKHNLRLVLFVINKYYQEIASGQKFNDLCQEGAKGLIIAIDRFEPKRRLRLSTYALFWMRHTMTRSLTTSSFIRVPFGLESVRMEIQKAKLELQFELGRLPTEDEIVAKVGISPERYRDVLRASRQVLSLNARHAVTQEEYINGITDNDGVDGDNRKQSTLLRLALDDVLDSLKPKESLVIRQRFGLDGKGERTLGEIAGNLNISREMVRKYELKALMKLKHPARVDYLRQHII